MNFRGRGDVELTVREMPAAAAARAKQTTSTR